jgi:uncharacterized protein
VARPIRNCGPEPFVLTRRDAADAARPPQGTALVVVGESCRALARSCRLAGWDVAAIDRYGDRDLLAVCHTVGAWPAASPRSATAPGPLWHALGALPAGPILPAGGMEQPRRAPPQVPPGFTYCGPQAEQLEQLRDVRQWRRWAKQAGLQFPTSQLRPADTAARPHDWPGGWLIKRSDSGGGLAVRTAVELAGTTTAHDPTGSESSMLSEAPPQHYLQQRLPGPTIGVVLASSESGSRLLGASLAVESHQWPGPRRFIYRGSHGPIQLAPQLLERLRRLAERIAEQTGIRGLWNVDLARGRRGQWYLLEINPRWSASMEMIELAGGGSLAALHLAAWGWTAPTRSAHRHADDHPPAHRRSAQAPANVESPPTQYADRQSAPRSVPSREAPPSSPPQLLKLVIYCRRTFQVTQQQSDALFAHRLPEPTSAEAVNLFGLSTSGWRLADIPKAGDYVPAGSPLMTLLVWGPRQHLWQTAHRVRQLRLPPLFLDGRSKV